MNIGRQLKRVKQQADHLFLRSDRCDVVGDLHNAEEQAEELRVLCEAYSRGVEKCLHTHQAPEEKKYRKVPEYQMAEILKDALKEGAKDQTISVGGPVNETMQSNLLRCVVECVTEVEQALGMEVIDYEEKVKADVLEPLQTIIKEDITSINKQKKNLKQVGLDVDAARGKYRSAQSNPAQNPKFDQIREELEEAESKLDQARDSYAYDIFSLLAREREVAQHVCGYLELQQRYLQTALDKVNNVLPEMKKQFEDSTASPVYGKPLHEHLSITHQKIAVPIGVCVRRLIEIGLNEEGLFRVAGSASKVKRLKGAFDANLVTDEALALIDEHDRDYDVHVVAGALKGYLRELPEPLFTLFLHDQWVEAVRKQEHQERLRAIWLVVTQLPQPNLDNVKYLFKFLQMLSTNSQVNKMTPSNIAIVIAPNLIWAQRENDEAPDMSTMGRNMSLSNDYRSLVDNLVEYCDYFFKDEIFDFGVTPRPPMPSSPSLSHHASSNGALPVNTTQTTQTNKLNVPPKTHKRNTSADFNTVRFGTIECESPKQPARRKKLAPQPPQKERGSGFGSGPYNNFSDLPSTPLHNSRENIMSSSSSPEQMLRSHTPPKDHSRSHTPPRDQQNSSATTVGKDGVTGPTAATRLHHSGSIKRPRDEPPKPPGGVVTVAIGVGTNKPPPRPSPPTQVHERLGTPPIEAMTSNNDTSSLPGSQPVPLGFEKVQSSTEVDSILDNHIDTIQLRRDPRGIGGSKENVAYTNGGPHTQIGFVVDHSDHSEDKENSPSPVNTNFRKSLASVIQQQAAAPPTTLPRLQSSSSDTSGGDTAAMSPTGDSSSSTIGGSPRAVSVLPPVPVQRTVVPATRTSSKERNEIHSSSAATEKPEPVEEQEEKSKSNVTFGTFDTRPVLNHVPFGPRPRGPRVRRSPFRRPIVTRIKRPLSREFKLVHHPRADKPAVPEKPSIMNRSTGFVEQAKPQVSERPILVTHRNTVSPQLLSQMTSFTEGMHSSGEHESRSKGGISGDSSSNLMTKSCENGLLSSRTNSSCSTDNNSSSSSNMEVNNSSSSSNNNSEDLSVAKLREKPSKPPKPIILRPVSLCADSEGSPISQDDEPTAHTSHNNCNSNKRSSFPVWPPQATTIMAASGTEPKHEEVLDSTNL